MYKQTTSLVVEWKTLNRIDYFWFAPDTSSDVQPAIHEADKWLQQEMAQP